VTAAATAMRTTCFVVMPARSGFSSRMVAA
jgi:hypothetical protein